MNRPGCSGPDEWLESYGEADAHAAVIGANLDPISGDAPGVTPYAAAIFLHPLQLLELGHAEADERLRVARLRRSRRHAPSRRP